MVMDSRAVGGAYHRVMVAGQQFSKHTTPHKAHEAAYDAGVSALAMIEAGTITEMPSIEVITSNRIVWEPDSDFTPAQLPAQPPAVVSEGGEDLGDFLDRTSGGVGDNPEAIPAGLHGDGDSLENFAISTQDKGFNIGTRLFLPDGNGVQRFVAWGWKGWVICWLWRKRGVLKINTEE